MPNESESTLGENQAMILPDHPKSRWEAKKLNDKHKTIIKMLAKGWSQTRIANEMGMSIPHVNRIANSPLIAEEVYRIQDEWGMALIKQRFQRILSNEDERGLEG